MLSFGVGQTIAVLFATTSLGLAAPRVERLNLLKNGSFEGSARYWLETSNERLMKGSRAAGEYSLAVPKGAVQSAPFLLEDGVPVTVSMSLRADQLTEVKIDIFPSHREIAQRSGLLWGKEGFRAKVGWEWKRVSFTFTPEVAHEKWWPDPVYMLMIGSGKAFQIDAVSVAYEAGAKKYEPRREIEVVSDSPDLKGYSDPSANLFEKGTTVNIVASVSNPGEKPRAVRLRWQLFDYEGVQAISAPIDKVVKVPGDSSRSETAQLTLTTSGLVLARVSALDGRLVLDSSDLPLTSLPYPKAAAKPDARERFGTSPGGLKHSALAQRIGFRWSRHFPRMSWAEHQKDGPASWRWVDQELDALEQLGFGVVATLYGRPAWAFEKDNPLPKDMQWAADDPRWEDLSVETAWDKFITGAVKHYAGRTILWELENEPELDGWHDLFEPYFKFTERTARLIKRADPKAVVMQNSMWPGPTPFQRKFFESGGAKFVDAWSWHDYHEGALGDARLFGAMRSFIDVRSGKHVKIQFNEGWAFTNPSTDEPALALGRLTGAEAANLAVSSVAELHASGQAQTILGRTGYEDCGRTFWDYHAQGTMLWDVSGDPLATVAAWNTLIHHLGLSEAVGIVRPPGATLCVFEDLRNERGVVVAFAESGAEADVHVPLPWSGYTQEDIMGNAEARSSEPLKLSRSGRPSFVYAAEKTPGKLFELLLPLDRKPDEKP